MWKLLCLSVILVLTFASCTHNSSNINTGVPSQPLIPLTAGNSWIYVDSMFSGSGTDSLNYADTMTINSQALELTSNNGNIPFYGVSDTNGYFGYGSYFGLDPSNTAIYIFDTAGGNTEPYTFFATSTVDNYLLGTGNGPDPNNPNCEDSYSLYGYATTQVVVGHTCLVNIQYTVNCSGITTEEIIEYIDPGVGIIRVADYELNSTGTALVPNFTQTLVSTSV